jgi:hypothetical protein
MNFYETVRAEFNLFMIITSLWWISEQDLSQSELSFMKYGKMDKIYLIQCYDIIDFKKYPVDIYLQ